MSVRYILNAKKLRFPKQVDACEDRKSTGPAAAKTTINIHSLRESGAARYFHAKFVTKISLKLHTVSS